MKNMFFPILLTCTHILFSNEIKFGKVSMEEVAQKEHAIEKDARAAILYKKEYVFYGYNDNKGWSTTKEVHYRIKIYSKAGFDWATFQIPLYFSKSGKERIGNVKGFTFNLIEGKVVSEKLGKDGVFEENVSKNRNKASITMPEVKEGSVLDIQYRVESSIYWYMDDYTFQYDIPMDRAELKLKIPEYFNFKKYSKGFYPIHIDQSQANRKIAVQYKSSDKSGITGRATHKSGSLDFTENVYEVNATRLPAMIEEKYTNNINNYRTAIKFELASTKFPNSTYKSYSQSWEDVAKSIYQYSSFGSELKKTNYFEDDLDELLSGITDNVQKATTIFDFVKSKMTWNQYYGVSCSRDGVKKAYEEGSGNVAEINLMLTSMLRYAGLNANPVLVSTRSYGIPLFPTRDGFNYVIAAIEIQNDVILLDATNKYAVPNVLPERALNWAGRLIRKEGSSSQIPLVPKTISKELVSINASINEDGSIEGKVRTQYTDQFALSFRNSYEPSDEETYLASLENHYGGMEISEYTIKNGGNLSKPVIETCDFFKEDECEIIGSKIYFSPMFFFAMEENPFKLEKREYPIDFTFPRLEKRMINIKIPEGYKIESVPESSAMQLTNGLGMYKFNIMATENQVQLVVSSEITTALVPTEYYDTLKEYYKRMVAKETEKVILSKI